MTDWLQQTTSDWLLLGLSHFLSWEVILPTCTCSGAYVDSNWDHIEKCHESKTFKFDVRLTKHFPSSAMFPAMSKLSPTIWVAVPTWGGKSHDMNFPSRELIFPIIPTAHECTGSYEPRWQEIPVSTWMHDSYPLQEWRLKMSFYLLALHPVSSKELNKSYGP